MKLSSVQRKLLESLVVVGLIAGTASVAAQTPAASHPPAAAANPLAQGQAAFRRTCNRCHPNGERDIGPRLIGKNLAEARTREIIRHGTGRMRAITPARLPDAQLPALMVYLRSIHAVQ